MIVWFLVFWVVIAFAHDLQYNLHYERYEIYKDTAIVHVDIEEAYSDVEKSLFQRYEKLFIGLGLILGIFGIFELYIRRLSWIKKFS